MAWGDLTLDPGVVRSLTQHFTLSSATIAATDDHLVAAKSRFEVELNKRIAAIVATYETPTAMYDALVADTSLIGLVNQALGLLYAHHVFTERSASPDSVDAERARGFLDQATSAIQAIAQIAPTKLGSTNAPLGEAHISAIAGGMTPGGETYFT